MNNLKTLWHHHKGFMLFIGLMFVFRSAVADWNYVPSSSMNPTLVAGDRVAVNKLAYSLRVPFTLWHIARWSSPQAGDVITFDSPLDELNLIKRVIAVAGDTVEMRENQLAINGQWVDRQLLDGHRQIPTEAGLLRAEVWRETLAGKSIEVARIPFANRHRDFAPVIVPAGMLMVLGDSRDNSNDSRFIGFIDANRVTGKAMRVVMSHDTQHLFVPRAKRWWLPMHSSPQG